MPFFYNAIQQKDNLTIPTQDICSKTQVYELQYSWGTKYNNLETEDVNFIFWCYPIETKRHVQDALSYNVPNP